MSLSQGRHHQMAQLFHLLSKKYIKTGTKICFQLEIKKFFFKFYLTNFCRTHLKYSLYRFLFWHSFKKLEEKMLYK